LIPSEPNYIKPGKRPLSSSSPTIIEHSNGTFYATLGAAGGPRIITTVAQILWHLLDRQISPAEALLEARLHDNLSPNGTSLEWPEGAVTGFDNQTAAFLASLGHKISYVRPTKSAAHIVLHRFDGTLEAASEPRHRLSSGIAE